MVVMGLAFILMIIAIGMDEWLPMSISRRVTEKVIDIVKVFLLVVV